MLVVGPVHLRWLASTIALKLLWSVADYSCVQRSALIAGLSLAISGLTLVGIGEWAAGRIGDTAPDDRSAVSLATASYGHPAIPISAPPLPALPESSDHLPAGLPGYTLRREVPEVRLQFTAADEQGRLVDNLSADEVEVFDNRAPVGHFSEFERNDNLPLALGLVVDTSDSVKRVLGEEKLAAASFLQRVLRRQSDTAFVMAFGGTAKIWQTSTGDRQPLLDAIARLKQPGWGSRMFDALYAACQAAESSAGQPSHHALIVLTDGDDTDSLRTMADVIAATQRAEVQVYALTIHAPGVADRGDRVLQRLADATGGRLYVAASGRQLDAAFAQIEQDLRTQYTVSFPPQQGTPGYHSLQVEVRAPQKLVIHAREGYYAAAQ